ncbi:glycoside hydrolase family 16 protein [Abortiporus biennis]|nr:glycoside hydrolase family 16 protein [Abortiporus biennis]
MAIFSGFTFFNAPDPTNGNVDFVDGDEAFASGLAQVQNDGTIVLAVDSTTQLTPGQNRKSVRVTSNKSYNSGTLFIADIFAMPHGCAVWPAYWMVGPNWPNGGEVDILEGVNDQTTNQITAHTGTNCHVNGGVQTLGKLLGGACQSANGVNAGCAFSLPDTSSYGHQFNLQSGGVYAHTWEPDAIKVYFFSRGAIPQDILDGKPDPDSWGTPAALFTDDTGCNIEDSFKDHSIVFDITLCGDWAGSAYGSMGCPGTCQQQVADPANFQLAQFKISSVKVYGHN